MEGWLNGWMDGMVDRSTYWCFRLGVVCVDGGGHGPLDGRVGMWVDRSMGMIEKYKEAEIW